MHISYFFGAKELEQVKLFKLPVRAYAGFLHNGFENIQVMAHELELVYVPRDMVRYPNKTLVIEVCGDSMSPEFEPEDNVVGELVEDWHDLKRGKMYVVVTDEDIVLKILYSMDNQKLILESRNKDYPNMNVEKQSIRYIFRVRGKFKLYD